MFALPQVPVPVPVPPPHPQLHCPPAGSKSPGGPLYPKARFSSSRPRFNPYLYEEDPTGNKQGRRSSSLTKKSPISRRPAIVVTGTAESIAAAAASSRCAAGEEAFLRPAVPWETGQVLPVPRCDGAVAQDVGPVQDTTRFDSSPSSAQFSPHEYYCWTPEVPYTSGPGRTWLSPQSTVSFVAHELPPPPHGLPSPDYSIAFHGDTNLSQGFVFPGRPPFFYPENDFTQVTKSDNTDPVVAQHPRPPDDASDTDITSSSVFRFSISAHDAEDIASPDQWSQGQGNQQVDDRCSPYGEAARHYLHSSHGDAVTPYEQRPWEVFSDQQILEDIATEQTPDDDEATTQVSEKPRKRLEGNARQETIDTRKWKACIRCRLQKIRCKPDPDDPLGNDCMSCRKICQESKKVIHRGACLRWKLIEAVTFRRGGLGLTQRWVGVRMRDLPAGGWSGNTIHTIDIRLPLCSTNVLSPLLKVRVRKFEPRKGDVLTKYYLLNQKQEEIPLPPFALADIRATAEVYKQYVQDSAVGVLEQYKNDVRPGEDELIGRTYGALYDYLPKLRFLRDQDKSQHKDKSVDLIEFLTSFFRLWFATRMTLGSAYIEADEALGEKANPHSLNPYDQKIWLPRMISAQFDSLAFICVLSPLRKYVFENLMKMIAAKNPEQFFTVYLTVFVLLHEYSATLADMMRRAKDLKTGTTYDRPEFANELREGANIVLSYWHYYRRGIDPLNMNWEAKNPVWEKLSVEEFELLADACRVYKTKSFYPRKEKDEGDKFFWISQMFVDNWHPI
ncbi:hypothetical protein F4778DRAFT_787894 [Xylariomycetidae sp. FL2044]|nr:hypothetical protein F4778DRAFT_787894 [Xylariomycetidae sp. FL2044]